MDRATASDGAGLRLTRGRRRRTLGQLWQVPTFLFGLVSFLLVAASAPYREDLFDRRFTDDLQALRQGLSDQESPQLLLPRVERVLAALDKHPRWTAEAHLLAGSAYFADAEANPRNVTSLVSAVEHLEEALRLAPAAEDAPALHYRLGVALYRQGADLPRAIELLASGAERGTTQREQAYRLLIEGHLALPTPDLDGALAASKKLLEISGDPEAVGQARLLRGELFLRKQQSIEALKELDRIGSQVSRGLRAQARLQQAKIAAEEGLWHRAANVWKELVPDAAEVPGGAGRIYYELGQCYASADPSNHAAAAKAWQDALALGGAEAQAARLRLGELSLYADDRADDALGHWQTALAGAQGPQDYQNPYLPLDKARTLIDQACGFFLDGQDYARMERAAELYKKLAAPGLADQRLAEAAEAHAQLLQKAAGEGADPGGVELIKAYFHRAGTAYESAAAVFAGSARTEPYWRSALCFLAAKDHARAAVVLEAYVTLEKDEPRLAQAFYSLAEAHAAQGRQEQARQAYYKCMEFPHTPYAYRARYQLALEQIAQKNFVHAKEILKQNLTSASPAMDREAHEKSLFKMAGLLVQLKAFDEAAWYLKEASRQYPGHPHALYARDLLADSYHKLAQQTKAKLDDLEAGRLETQTPERQAALDELKNHQRRTRGVWLHLTLEVYQALAEELEQRGRQRSLSSGELAILRRALFGVADVRFDLNEFGEALRLYQALHQRYPRQVEGLIACERMWRCVGVIVHPPEQARWARETATAAINSAQADLKSMDKDNPVFHGAGMWSWQHWHDELARWTSRLNEASQPAPRPNLLAN